MPDVVTQTTKFSGTIRTLKRMIQAIKGLQKLTRCAPKVPIGTTGFFATIAAMPPVQVSFRPAIVITASAFWTAIIFSADRIGLPPAARLIGKKKGQYILLSLSL